VTRLDAHHTNPCNTSRFVEYVVICVIVQKERECVGLGVRDLHGGIETCTEAMAQHDK